MGIRVAGIGAYVPERTVPNAELAATVDTSHEWIVAKTGIVERRLSRHDETPSDMGYQAALRCLEHAGVDKSAVDLLVVACATPDQSQPAVACLIQEKLGIAELQAPSFDVNSVCAGFVFALNVAQSIMLTDPAKYRNALVIGTDAFSKIMNWRDRGTCIFFGDGAGAVLLSQTDRNEQRMHFRLGSDGRGSRYIQVPAGGTRIPVTKEVLDERLNAFVMDGRKVWDFALDTVPRAMLGLLAEHHLEASQLDLVISAPEQPADDRGDHGGPRAVDGPRRHHGRIVRQHGRGQHSIDPAEGLGPGPPAAGSARDALRLRRRAFLGRGPRHLVSDSWAPLSSQVRPAESALDSRSSWPDPAGTSS